MCVALFSKYIISSILHVLPFSWVGIIPTVLLVIELEIESGAAINEPTNYAIRSAIEFAVLQMIEKGEVQSLWKYKKEEKKWKK